MLGLDGNDTLRGDLGGDRLTGGAGDDVFRYFDLADSPTAGPRDVVTDFTQGDDVFGLAGIDAAVPLAFIGHGVAFGGVAGELRSDDNGANSIVEIDANGDAVADFTVNVTGVVVFVAADFVF